MNKILTLTPSNPKFYVSLSFDYDHELKEWVKNLPGVKNNSAWEPLTKTWRVPASFVGPISRVFEGRGYEVQDLR